MAGRKPGGPKTGGRQKGTINKTSEDLKELYVSLLGDNIERMQSALDSLFLKDPYQFLMAMDKVSQKVVPNKKDITSDGESIAPQINISENRAKS
jgi:hypothetical protein